MGSTGPAVMQSFRSRVRTHGAHAGWLALLLLAGCSGTVQEKFGAGPRAPDEFKVVRRAPLVLPPDYNLRPPGETKGAVRRSASDDAREIVTGSSQSAAAASSGEKALLDQVKVEADPTIREKLLDENTELTQIEDETFLFILDWQRDSMTYADAVIDPDAESERLLGEGKARRVTTRRVSSEAVTNPGGG
ncbi:MAG: DUF3035 domain-containing protein [Geminicoccaceae bacterium]